MTDTLDLNEAAALMKVDPETLRQLASNGDVFGAKIGRAWVFLKADLVDYLYRMAREQTAIRRSGGPVEITTGPVRPSNRRFRDPPQLP